jgi:phosphate transport system substrate-binding protein
LKFRQAILTAIFGAATLLMGVAQSQGLTGAGSSAAAPIYRSWAAQYQQHGGPGLTYEPIGSSAGVKKIKAEQTGFGATDVAPPPDELKSSGLVLFPIAITGIAPVVNLPIARDGQLRLTGPVLARIFLGEITQWNDPAITQLNTELSLPAMAIKVVVRSDGSGTTYNFADYLSKVNSNWKTTYGVKSSFPWPSTFIASKGSDGIVKSVKENIGSIGYVDYGYVKDNKLQSIQMAGADGEFIQPSVMSFRAAMQNSEWNSKGTFSSTLTNIPGKGAWPITMGTFVLVPQIAKNPEQTTAVLQFFVWAFMNGDALVQQNNFVRLPDRMQSLAFKAIASVREPSGKTLNLRLQ